MKIWEKIKSIFSKNKVKMLEESKNEEFWLSLPQMNLEQIDEKSKIFNISDTKFQVIHTNNYSDKIYDTTRLELDTESKKIVENKEVYKGLVSWYSSENQDVNEVAVTSSSTYVTFDIDIDKIKEDKSYLNIVMSDLLEKNAVECFRDQGFQEKPQIHCGNYIGGVEHETGKVMFDKKIGIEIHNSIEMVTERQKFMEFNS